VSFPLSQSATATPSPRRQRAADKLRSDEGQHAPRAFSGAGVRPDISERVLPHAIKSVEAVYDRYGYLPEKLDALTKLDALVDRIFAMDVD
jgi:hypothetical protein